MIASALGWCADSKSTWADDEFPTELVRFEPYAGNPVFVAAGPKNWDARIRERGWILREGEQYRMWYTGYSGDRTGPMLLGLATSPDGLHWTRHPANPLLANEWVEDMMVVRDGSRYVMVAEGRGDIAQWLTSTDGVRWTRQGPMDVRLTDGRPLPPGPYGTPVLFKDFRKKKVDGVQSSSAVLQAERWLFYYERQDLGIWVAESTDFKRWTNVSDEPVIARGPAEYDRHAVALNQIVEHGGRYYAYYHASASDQKGRRWSSCVAMSTDLVHWKKYPGNPILQDNKSSPILIFDGKQHRLYTMHDKVQAHFPAVGR